MTCVNTIPYTNTHIRDSKAHHTKPHAPCTYLCVTTRCIDPGALSISPQASRASPNTSTTGYRPSMQNAAGCSLQQRYRSGCCCAASTACVVVDGWGMYMQYEYQHVLSCASTVHAGCIYALPHKQPPLHYTPPHRTVAHALKKAQVGLSQCIQCNEGTCTISPDDVCSGGCTSNGAGKATIKRNTV